jgi:hypothetical protein
MPPVMSTLSIKERFANKGYCFINERCVIHDVISQ